MSLSWLLWHQKGLLDLQGASSETLSFFFSFPQRIADCQSFCCLCAYPSYIRFLCNSSTQLSRSKWYFTHQISPWKPQIYCNYHLSSVKRTPCCVLQIQVWDTAGQERFRTITQSYYRSAHGAMIAYDITRRSTFDSVTHWIKEVELYGASNVVLVLIGECELGF